MAKALMAIILLFSTQVMAQAKVKKAQPQKGKEAKVLDKTPKAIFLIKRAKIDADIGEPVLYPFDRQMKNLYYDLRGGALSNE